MKKIKLTKGKYAIVDDDNYEWLNQWKWCAREKGDLVYAGRNDWLNKRNHILTMQHQIMGVPTSQEIDHINGNPLDNRVNNLRTCSHRQNLKTKRFQKITLLGIKVSFGIKQ